MPRFAANLSMLFPDLPFMARFEAAAEAGFEGVEFLFPYAFDPAEIRQELDRLNLAIALFNAPAGDFDAGERGLSALTGREAEFQASFETALRFAEIIRPERLHVMAGLAYGPPAQKTYVDNLIYAAAAAAKRLPNIPLVIEPINTRDMPGYFLNFTEQALAVIDAVGADNLMLQLDLYHAQIMEGDLSRKIEALTPRIGHVQISSVPDRNEPDAGEINYPHLFERLDAAGYKGWVGCEYRPRANTNDGLAWFAPYARKP
ncbi:MAG: hydroxypyruvate isomerase family protein [Rhodobacteraceae bacterium]|nr:hydroxypyruvate isomerase family protein [Paracoccaceae bacterium]